MSILDVSILDVVMAISTVVIGSIAALSYIQSRKALKISKLNRDDNRNARIVLIIIRGRLAEGSRQNIHIMVRNDGSFPAYDVDVQVPKATMMYAPKGLAAGAMLHGLHKKETISHIFPIIDPKKYALISLGSSAHLEDIIELLRKKKVKITYKESSGSPVERTCKPFYHGAELSGHDNPKGILLDPKPVSFREDFF